MTFWCEGCGTKWVVIPMKLNWQCPTCGQMSIQDSKEEGRDR